MMMKYVHCLELRISVFSDVVSFFKAIDDE